MNIIVSYAFLLSLALRVNTLNLTIADIDLLNRCVMSEAGNQDMETQEAVATVILNRVVCEDKFPNTVEGVITQKNQFSMANNGEPTADVKYSVVIAILKFQTPDQDISPSCYYFRSGKYHNFGIQYRKIGDLYFSLAENYAE